MNQPQAQLPVPESTMSLRQNADIHARTRIDSDNQNVRLELEQLAARLRHILRTFDTVLPQNYN